MHLKLSAVKPGEKREACDGNSEQYSHSSKETETSAKRVLDL